ncbi:MAG: GNAT family N-acetyltransferase [Stenotrophomonas maltophilia]
MTIKFTLLRDRPELLPVVAQWYFDEWGTSVPGHSLAVERQHLEASDHGEDLPMVLIALEAGRPVATARVKRHERRERPEREFWLGSVYVAPSHRGQGLAGLLVNELMSRAVELGICDVYLQTKVDDGGLYRRLGWLPLESILHERGFQVRVMRRAARYNAGKVPVGSA